MERQLLHFKPNYLKYPFILELNLLWNIFADEEVETNAKNKILYESSKNIVESMEIGLNKHYNFMYKKDPSPINTALNNNFILCCVSGGKDSLATALYYKQLGYNILLYTVRGINRGYPEEYKAAVRISEKMKIPIIIDEIKMTGKKFYMEHPLKNQIIASMAIAYCLDNNLTPNIAFGNYREDINNRSNWGVNWTDNFDLWIAYNNFIKSHVKNAIVNIPFYSESEALDILSKNFEYVPLYQSCLMTVRNRNQLKNIMKRNIK